MNVVLRSVLPHEVMHTSGRFVADMLAYQMPPAAVLRFSSALHSVADCCDGQIADPAALPPGFPTIAGAWADTLEPGEAFVIYADAHPRRGRATTVLKISTILAGRDASLRVGLRKIQAIATARRLNRVVAERAARPDSETVRACLERLVALVLDARDFDQLLVMTGCVPVVAIAGDTRATGPTSGKFFRAVTHLPGAWLGTAPHAGCA